MIKEQGFLKLERFLFFYWNCDRSTEPQAIEKFFDPTIFQKCWRGVGEEPTFAKQIRFLRIAFPAAIASFETVQFKQSCIMKIKVVSSSKATGQLQHTGRQKQGWNPLLPDGKDRFL